MSYQPIENYGIVGNLETVALVGIDGSIDFMSFPEFDSPTIFAALVDDEKGGRFRITPQLGHARQMQMYLPETNVLMTRFLAPTGVAEIIDFMPITDDPHRSAIVRQVRTVRGSVAFRVECAPRFDYGRAGHTTRRAKNSVLFRSKGKDGTVVRLRSTRKLELKGGDVVGEFELRAGETVDFFLENGAVEQTSAHDLREWCSNSFRETVSYWRNWSGRSRYRGRWREVVQRSALTLKLLTSRRHGSLVAAATFGLPEGVGGERNWDYRFTWIRDSSFTLYSLLRLGYSEEAAAFMRWIEARCNELNPDGSLQIMYGIDGRHKLPEKFLKHFEGYRQSQPVRIGNAAYGQLQLDIYGELMDSVYLYDKHGSPISIDLWENLIRLIDWVDKNWKGKDEGIWEVRGGQREFLYSRLMCWVAMDRGIRLAERRSLPAPIVRWRKTRDAIHKEILTKFWSKKRKAFVQYSGSDTLDAACLLMPMVQFIAPDDPRWLSTLKGIGEELVEDSLVYRYRTQDAASDGLKGQEGTFNMCSFWYIECLARAGQTEQARLLFDKMLGYGNHLGLFSEELGASGEHLGNTPQAFTHLGLISAALALNWSLDGGLQR